MCENKLKCGMGFNQYYSAEVLEGSRVVDACMHACVAM